MRYDRIYELLAGRGIRQTEIDLETYVAMATESGLSAQTIEEALLADLDEGGPIFGKFWRSLTGAAESSVSAAMRQGQTVGTILDYDKEMAALMERREIADRVDDGDPELLAEIEAKAQDWLETWVCTLINTCLRCLPLHGKTLFHSEWGARGLTEDRMHEGWNSSCLCMRIPADQFDGADSQQIKNDLASPLVRVKQKTETGLKVSRRTARSVAAYDITRAQEAVTKANESLEGRRTLRVLGKVGNE